MTDFFSFQMYLNFVIVFENTFEVLQCFFLKILGQSTQYKLLDLSYLPRPISVRCRYTRYIYCSNTERQISVQATYIYQCDTAEK